MTNPMIRIAEIQRARAEMTNPVPPVSLRTYEEVLDLVEFHDDGAAYPKGWKARAEQEKASRPFDLREWLRNWVLESLRREIKF